MIIWSVRHNCTIEITITLNTATGQSEKLKLVCKHFSFPRKEKLLTRISYYIIYNNYIDDVTSRRLQVKLISVWEVL